MPKIENSQQTRNGNSCVMSSSVPVVVYETALRCAELHGYSSMSAFIKDAILEKMQTTSMAISSICQKNKAMQPVEMGL